MRVEGVGRVRKKLSAGQGMWGEGSFMAQKSSAVHPKGQRTAGIAFG